MDYTQLLIILRSIVDEQGYTLNDDRAIEIYQGFKRASNFAEANSGNVKRYARKSDLNNINICLEFENSDAFPERFIFDYLIEFATDFVFEIDGEKITLVLIYCGLVNY